MNIKDTGSTRFISHLLILKNNFLYNITSLNDTLNVSELFLQAFFNSFAPQQPTQGRDLYQSRLALYFSDLFSKDSVVQNRAQQSIGNVYYGIEGIPLLVDAINKVNVTDKKYFDTKTKLIAELGFISDSTSDVLVSHLKNIYSSTADTSLFQNEVIQVPERFNVAGSSHL